jgi:hypothetical protein
MIILTINGIQFTKRSEREKAKYATAASQGLRSQTRKRNNAKKEPTLS